MKVTGDVPQFSSKYCDDIICTLLRCTVNKRRVSIDIYLENSSNKVSWKKSFSKEIILN